MCGELVDLTDFLPTLADLADADLPADIPFDGRSIAPQLAGEAGTQREWIYCWYERNGKRNNASEHLRNQQYKLYRDGRFYDVVADTAEETALDMSQLDDDAERALAMFQEALSAIEVPEVALPGGR